MDILRVMNVILQHRLICNVHTIKRKEKSVDVDHMNHKKNDNRKKNLRVTSHKNNNKNCVLAKNNSSGVTGVSWYKRYSKWEANIMIDGKKKYLGRFTDFDEAVKARKKAEEKYFGEYSYDNSMKEGVV